MNDYKFSVLMSVYYKENPKHFAEALKSNLINQTLKPDEMVLICDGDLTDELNEVIAQYEELFPGILNVYRLEFNSGLGNALNYGLSKCKYDWVARSDSDDICVNNRFEVQIEFLKSNPDIDIVSSYISEFDNDLSDLSQCKKMPLSHSEIVKMTKIRNPINHMAVMFRRKTILQIGSYKHLPCIEDYFLWVRAICNGAKLANIDKVLVYVRIGNGMVQRRSNKDYIRSWKILSKYMLDNNLINSIECARNILSIYVFVYTPVRMKKMLYKYILRR